MGEGEMCSIPDEFSAAGLMVPEPSIMPFPRPPFDKAEIGCDIEYMPVAVRGRTCGLLWSELQPSRGRCALSGVDGHRGRRKSNCSGEVVVALDGMRAEAISQGG